MINNNWQRQHAVFITLLLLAFVLLGLLAVRYDKQVDITQQKINGLSNKTLGILNKVEHPLLITAFVRGNPKTKLLINRIVSQYKQQNPLIKLDFKNPDSEIALVRQYDIKQDGELYLSYQDNAEHVTDLSETSISRAIYALVETKQKTVSFLSGQGERGISKANFDYQQLAEALHQQNISVNQQDINLVKKIADNTDVLVIAEPRLTLSLHNRKIIKQYIQRGGNLLFLAESSADKLPHIMSELGLSVSEGVIINDYGKKYKLDNNRYIISEPQSIYPPLSNINAMLLFPQVAPIDLQVSSVWQATELLKTQGKGYILTGQDISGGDKAVVFGVELNRIINEKRQRIVVIGDADFMSNQFIGNGQNLVFARQLLDFLASPSAQFVIDDKPLIQPVMIPSNTLTILAILLMFVFPIGILILGFVVRRRLR